MAVLSEPFRKALHDFFIAGTKLSNAWDESANAVDVSDLLPISFDEWLMEFYSRFVD
jgi:hypothetical protein